MALAVLSLALVFLGDGTPGLVVSHQGTPQILALGSTDGALLCRSLLWDPTSDKDLLWESQIQAEDQFLVQVSSVLLQLIVLHIPVMSMCSDDSGFGHMHHLGWLANHLEALS